MSTAGSRTGDEGAPLVEVRRSRNRRRTVAAYREQDRVVVLLPARFTPAEEQEWVAAMLARLERSERRRRPGDAALARRAADLSTRHLEGRAVPASVRWVENQGSRWGSCTPGDGSIRLSTRLRGMPSWVIDYVLVHELAHLIEAGHTAVFWSWVDRYPRAERAKGFLEGVAAATHLGLEADPPDCPPEDAAERAAPEVGHEADHETAQETAHGAVREPAQETARETGERPGRARARAVRVRQP